LPDCCRVRNEGAFSRANVRVRNAFAGVGLTAGNENVICEPVYSASLLNGEVAQASDVATYISSTSLVWHSDLAVVTLSLRLAHAFTVIVAGA